MTAKIGIARALYSYYHYSLFKTFFETLGGSVLLSPRTNKEILKAGIENAPAEICLPVKTFIGHIAYLKDKVDYLFVPRIVCVKDSLDERFGCPKAIGLPDLIKATFNQLPPILELNWDERITDLRGAFKIAIKSFPQNGKTANQAFRQAQQNQLRTDQLLTQGLTPDQIYDTQSGISVPESEISLKLPTVLQPPNHNGLTVGVVGHPYLLFDEMLSLGILEKLKSFDVSVITPSMLSPNIIRSSSERFKELTWLYEQEILGSATYFLNNRKIDGLLLISSFACGTSAVVNEIIQREIARSAHIPILILLLDEHSSETGIMTRLESFIDLISRNKKVKT